MSALGLRDILLRRGLIEAEEVTSLVAAADEAGEALGEYLCRRKRLSEDELLDVRAEQYGLPLVSSVDPATAAEDVIRALPFQYLKQNRAFPYRDAEGRLHLALGDPSALDVVGDLRALVGGPVDPVLAPRLQILSALNRAYGEAGDGEEFEGLSLDDAEGLQDIEESVGDLLEETSDAPFIRLVNGILARAIKERASDIHIEPYQEELKVRFRLDGVLYDRYTFSRRMHAAVVSRIKILARLDIAERRLPQDGRISLALGGRKVDLRVSCLPTAYGERVVMRLLEKSSRVLGLEELGMLPDDLTLLKRLVTISHGIILITGPTGSGKTTTLYGILNHINSPDKNILTIEDPVEYQLDGIGQMQVQEKIDLTFAKGLRSIVRQDPDVILIGEIRDRETAEIAVQAALTGHLVFSTLHTNDAASAVTRLIDIGIEPFLVSSVLRAIIAQRLVRQLCPVCREPYTPDAAELADLDHRFDDPASLTFHRAVGCERCRGTGYRGRKAIMEVLTVDDAMKRLIVQTTDSNRIREAALKAGMRTLNGAGCQHILAGETTVTEIMRATRTI
ncbi:general secretion pathway protein E [Desulfobaculum xiamenense]|uniref:protein-secreting ATPase n=1 Tax=Desulfobaculum xiamenense TaxID=995050 RepID=A0A846QKP5_9BACT|nr:type II secretion system ATPase GspE [Desulfobaculum xiamenense]NJB68758.1 general secretion pathway protein E [Desulfobaculum xiamenense]